MEADSSETDPIELPDRVVALLGNVADPHEVELVPDPGAGWSARGISVRISRPERRADLSIAVEATVPLRGLVLDWPNPLPDGAAVLGDAWERSYGELGWRSAERAGVLPWSWIGRAVTGAALRGRGVRVRPNAFCG